MDARKFLNSKPEAEAAKVAKKAGTTLAYLKQLAYGQRTPRPKLAEALEQASGGEMTKLELLFPPKSDAKATGARP